MATLSSLLAKLNDSKAASKDECHACASKVVKVLSGVKVEKPEDGTLETFTAALKAVKAGKNAVYRVDVPQCGHSFAVVQEGSNVVIAQSWVNCYTLKDWLDGTADSVKENAYLPKGGAGAMDYKILTTILTTMSTSLAARKGDVVADTATKLFNPTGARVTVLKMACNGAKGSPLDVKWVQKTF